MFRSFFLGGFECSMGRHALGGWVDQVAGTGHDRQADEDYALLRSAGMRAARDGLRWPLVDRGGSLSFDSVRNQLEAARRTQVQVLWDLFHFGYPQELDPFQMSFRTRFAAYASAAARLIAQENGPPLFVPVNEPSYLAWAGGDMGTWNPGTRGRGPDLKRALVEAAIVGMEAAREACPTARFVHVDPIVRVVPPEDRPDLASAAAAFNDGAVFEAWDQLAARGALDVVGVNYYWTNQWEMDRPGHLPLDDPRREPLSSLLRSVWRRYGRPILLSETSHVGPQRADWMREAAREVAVCLAEGIPIVGLCWYPILSMPEWHDPSQWTPLGLWDLEAEDDRLKRVPCVPALEALEEARTILAPWLREEELQPSFRA